MVGETVSHYRIVAEIEGGIPVGSDGRPWRLRM
jgi:hypothetical protein